MQYLLLIYEDEKNWVGISDEAGAKIMAEYRAFGDGITKSKNMVGGNALQPVSTATSVRVRNGKTLSTDGPFAETKEQLGGYYLIEAKDLDEAVAIAAKIPA